MINKFKLSLLLGAVLLIARSGEISGQAQTAQQYVTAAIASCASSNPPSQAPYCMNTAGGTGAGLPISSQLVCLASSFDNLPNSLSAGLCAAEYSNTQAIWQALGYISLKACNVDPSLVKGGFPSDIWGICTSLQRQKILWAVAYCKRPFLDKISNFGSINYQRPYYGWCDVSNNLVQCADSMLDEACLSANPIEQPCIEQVAMHNCVLANLPI